MLALFGEPLELCSFYIPDGDSHACPPRPRPDPGIGAGRLHGRHLRSSCDAQALACAGNSAWRPAHDHNRRRELSGLRQGHPGPLADGGDEGPGRACGNRNRRRHDYRGSPQGQADLAARRFGAGIHLRCPHHLHRRPGQMAQPAVGGEVQGLRRLGLRHLRWVLLPRSQGPGDRRRQHRRRGGPLPHQFCLRSDGHSPPRFLQG